MIFRLGKPNEDSDRKTEHFKALTKNNREKQYLGDFSDVMYSETCHPPGSSKLRNDG